MPFRGAPAPLPWTAARPDDVDRRRRPIFLLLPLLEFISLTILLSFPVPSRGAHSRRARTAPTTATNRPPPRYDRSITTFSADGRLLQVEYGMKASDRGLTVAAFDLDFGVSNGEEAVCVAVVVSDVSSDDDTDSGREGGESTKVHRLDDHLLAATTGLSGDGRALASSVRVACRRMRLSNGEPATVGEAAAVMGDAQHQLTRIGGARPFGVSGTIWGVDPFPEAEEEDVSVGGGEGGGGEEVGGNETTTTRRRKPKLYQSEPGGIVERYDVCAAGRGRVEAVKALLVLRARLKDTAAAAASSLTKDDATSEDASSSLLAEAVRGVARAALESDGNAPGAPPPSTEDAVGGAGGTDKTERKRRADVYVVQADPKRRGGSRVRCARNVRLEDLEDLGKEFVR